MQILKRLCLKKDIDYPDFFRAVSECRKDVIFVTDDGDALNLKSELSKFVFASLLSSQAPSSGEEILDRGSVRCMAREDVKRLTEFLIIE